MSPDANDGRNAQKQQMREEWNALVDRLEQDRLRAIGEHKELEAQALDEAATSRGDGETDELRVAANAKRASAKEFLKAMHSIDSGSRKGEPESSPQDEEGHET